MSVLLIGALETERSGGTGALVLCMASGHGLIHPAPLHDCVRRDRTCDAPGSTSNPRRDRGRRQPGAIVLWYLPHIDDIAVSALAEYGHQIDIAWLATAPIDQTLVPAMTLLDDAFVAPSLSSVLWAAAGALLATSPLIRHRGQAFMLCSGVVAPCRVLDNRHVCRAAVPQLPPRTAVHARGFRVCNRAGSRLTRPSPASNDGRGRNVRPTCRCSAPLLLDVPRMPRDAGSDAANTIRELVPRSTPVFAHVAYPMISRSISVERSRLVDSLRSTKGLRDRNLAVYVDQPYLVPPVSVSCTNVQAHSTAGSPSTPEDGGSMSGSSPRQPEPASTSGGRRVRGCLRRSRRGARVVAAAHSGTASGTTRSSWSSIRPAGTGEILAGAELSHELIAILAWGTSALVGESEIAFRLWSAVPFIAGVVLVTSGSTGASARSPGAVPLPRDGVAFAPRHHATGTRLRTRVFRDERPRRRRTRGPSPARPAVVAACAAGVVGTWTLPQFGVAFVATAASSCSTRCGARRQSASSPLSSRSCWYAPHLGEVRSASQIEDGVQIGFPGWSRRQSTRYSSPRSSGSMELRSSGVVWLPLVVAVLVDRASPLLPPATRPSALLGPLRRSLVLWIAQAYVIPRYLSYLLVPLFVLLATGAASTLGRVARRDALVPSVCASSPRSPRGSVRLPLHPTSSACRAKRIEMSLRSSPHAGVPCRSSPTCVIRKTSRSTSAGR